MTDHPIVSEEFQKDGYNPDQIDLLKRKGVYPYDFTTSLDALKVDRLPAIEQFYSYPSEEGISETDYEHARLVWDTFGIQNLGQYSYFYLKTDVLLLADVFENFRENCMQAYGLDAAWYFTTPGFSWDAMLKLTNVSLELLTEVDMLLFVEKGIRGGVSQCSNRHATANNQYMETYDENQEDRYLVYFDVNNLYGWAMMEYLPYRGFIWLENPTMESKFWDVPTDSDVGFFIEVDLEYPEELHDLHKDIPFCPEHRAAPRSKQVKLMTTLYKKEKYVLHYRVLQQALSHGLILKKIHRALSFKQGPWLKSYIDFNSAKRKEAKNEFEKMLYKLFNNAVYGKTMENERKRVDVRLVNKWEGRYGAEALISKPNFHSSTIFTENLVAV